MIIKILGKIVVVFLVFALFVGGAQPQAVGLFESPLDKVAHIFYYAVITLCLERLIGLRLSLSVFYALSIGIADEIHQLYLPGRTADILDFTADAFGISLSAIIIKIVAVHK